jgi:hypothetical protein
LVLTLYLMRMMWILYYLAKIRVLTTHLQSSTSQKSIDLSRHSRQIIRLLGPTNRTTTIRGHIMNRDYLRTLCLRLIFLISMGMILKFG